MTDQILAAANFVPSGRKGVKKEGKRKKPYEAVLVGPEVTLRLSASVSRRESAVCSVGSSFLGGAWKLITCCIMSTPGIGSLEKAGCMCQHWWLRALSEDTTDNPTVLGVDVPGRFLAKISRRSNIIRRLTCISYQRDNYSNIN